MIGTKNPTVYNKIPDCIVVWWILEPPIQFGANYFQMASIADQTLVNQKNQVLMPKFALHCVKDIAPKSTTEIVVWRSPEILAEGFFVLERRHKSKAATEGLETMPDHRYVWLAECETQWIMTTWKRDQTTLPCCKLMGVNIFWPPRTGFELFSEKSLP